MLAGLGEDAALSARVAHDETTSCGNTGLAWVAPDALAVGDDRGNVTIWQVSTFAGAGAAPASATTAAPPEATMTSLVVFGEHTQPVTAIAAGASPTAPV